MTLFTACLKVLGAGGPHMQRAVWLILLILVMPISLVDGRSVHAVHDEDLFPAGDMNTPADWEFKLHNSFTSEQAANDGQYISGMISDSHMTLGIDLPQNIESSTVWASATSTDSNASIGYPDGAYTWSTGPDITLNTFDLSPYLSRTIISVDLMIHFDVPDALQQDKVRISVINNGIHDLVKTWGNTQSGLFYMNSGWSLEINDTDGWTWNELSNLEINLDYVSIGGTDDSQLQVDAVGLRIEMETPWSGTERAIGVSTNTVDQWPIIDMNLSEGTYDSVSIAPCGLESEGGIWTTQSLAKPSGQSWGRIHVDHTVENSTLIIEYLDDQDSWSSISNGMIPIISGDLVLKISFSSTCLTRVWVDINDPSIHIDGNLNGAILGLDLERSAWTIQVNGQTVSNVDFSTLGAFDLTFPIGHLMSPESLELEIMVKSFFTWNSTGPANNLSLRVNNLNVVGGFSIVYDENPVCQKIGSFEMEEDGSGLILPLVARCSDDRDDADELEITFQNDAPDVIEVDLTQGQIRVRLIPGASGVAHVTTTVVDSSGNSWSEISTFTVANVDDSPQLAEFPPIVPVELGITKEIPFTVSDQDTIDNDLVITTNRSWATIDMVNRLIIVDGPTPGFTSVLVTACDETSCDERILDLEIRALPDLSIEEIRVMTELVFAGDIIDIKVMVRNSGQVSATMITVRCLADDQTISTGTIPVLMPGELGSVICDWQAPVDDSSVLLEAIVDRGTQIDESNEDNNQDSIVIAIGEAVQEPVISDGTSSFQVSQTTLLLGAGAVLLLILTIFGLFAPAKIKKIE
ncbi:MAG TPA: hypothetical protein EYQ73_04955 [Candidatus Poseidoniales archaeon]|jgi:hypothetical protein|nr:MAG: hypothetical protein CXT71_07670 [Euryarchaeota archaeon]HIF46128.1 hypothetical protein [Candidatus Poseidoniales archaeon]HIL65856.1 hypothetical protein [Candidatus Poseidoniales archaeon]